IPSNIDALVTEVFSKGGTPLIVLENQLSFGVIYIKDVIQDRLAARFQEFRQHCHETVMCTCHNDVLAVTSAKESSVHPFIADCIPAAQTTVSTQDKEKDT
ncbi:potassium-transporting ATPase subunit B, partial [Staphylococcus pseudintermedius]